MNGRQLAALGPRYTNFKEVYGHTSGVALGCALAYGIDVDAFIRAVSSGSIDGELVLKVWTRKTPSRMLWCYVAEDTGELRCFPAFPDEREGSAVRTLMAAPIGSNVHAELEVGASGLAVCRFAAAHVT